MGKNKEDFFKQLEDDYINFKKLDPNATSLKSDKNIDSENSYELNERDKCYTDLLSKFVHIYDKNQDEKYKRKWKFYNIIIVIFILLILLILIGVIVISINYHQDKITLLATYITSFAGIFSALIALPNTIAKYLFNPKEDEVISKVVIEMQKQDIKNRQINRRILDLLDEEKNR